MNLVQSALHRLVTVLGVVLSAWLALQKMPRDLFSLLGIPTPYVARPFGGTGPG